LQDDSCAHNVYMIGSRFRYLSSVWFAQSVSWPPAPFPARHLLSPAKRLVMPTALANEIVQLYD